MGNNPNSNNNNNNRRPLGNIINRVFESAGPDGKVRGTPQQIIDKYQALARDAQLSGDRVAAESFLQHSEHYSRLLGEAQSQQNDARPYERDDGPRDDGPRNDARRDDSNRSEGSRNDGDRNDGNRGDAYDQPRPPRPEGQPQRLPQPAFTSGLAMIDPAEDGEFGGLIETPESAAAAPPKAPAVEPVANGGANGVRHAAAGDPVQDGGARETAKRPRPRRKARPDGDPAAQPE